MGKKHRKPKTKMRSYGGEELPIVKTKEGLFKKPEFYLADEKFDNLGHGDFVGQDTGKLEGPSKRAIKGKGKGAKNVRVYSEGGDGDPIFLQDTSPMKQKYSSQSGMQSAVKRWESPHKLTGDPDKSTFNYADKNRAKTEKEKFGVTSKKGEKEIAKEKKKADKEAYKKTDEFKEKDASRRSKVNQVGKALMDFAGLDTSNINIDSPKKNTEPSEGEKDDKVTVDTSHLKTPDKSKKEKEEEEEVIKVEGESSNIQRRGDLEVMSSMMRKIKNPQKRS